ncbi:MAG: M20/M25/M40 family metallo-hydrolase [Planctomycetaceae bacterium]
MRRPSIPCRPAAFRRLDGLARAAAVAIAATASWPASAPAADIPSGASPGIRAGDAGRHIGILADDSFEGREGGSRGGRAAAAYIVEQLERLDLRPAGDAGTWYQALGSLRNVLALLPGSDPTVARELVVVGAHYDHVGYGKAANSYGPFGFVHNGADDNASGVAGLLEVAEALAHLEPRPKRPILVAFWDGEEQGLLGSRHFLRVRPAAVADATVVFSVNLDMIGRLRGQRLEVYGTRTATGLRSLVTRANSDPAVAAGLSLAFMWDIEDDSDHYPFIAAGIPTVMFHTGLHDQYHRPSDDVHLVNVDGIEPVARLTLGFVRELADAAGPPPAFRTASRGESDATKRRLESPAPLGPGAPRGRWGLGSRPDPGEPGSAIVVRVTPGSPAAAAGVLVGDRIVAVGGTAAVSHDDVLARLRAAAGQAAIDVDRNGTIVRLLLDEGDAAANPAPTAQ